MFKFEWDSDKARDNLLKHGVAFEDAIQALSDPLEVTVPDITLGTAEDRWISAGLTHNLRLLVVCYTERGDTIRIISARQATRQERKHYEEGQR